MHLTGGTGGEGHNAGGGGGVASGPGAHTEGGRGGGGFTLFEKFAKDALGSPLSLSDYLRQQGFAPDDPRLYYEFGRGGDGEGSHSPHGEKGSDGMVLIQAVDDTGKPIGPPSIHVTPETLEELNRLEDGDSSDGQ